jgi:hypothetical protein
MHRCLHAFGKTWGDHISPLHLLHLWHMQAAFQSKLEEDRQRLAAAREAAREQQARLARVRAWLLAVLGTSRGDIRVCWSSAV